MLRDHSLEPSVNGNNDLLVHVARDIKRQRGDTLGNAAASKLVTVVILDIEESVVLAVGFSNLLCAVFRR